MGKVFLNIPLRLVVTLGGLLLILAGCASAADRVQETEQMLAAAGFRAHPADSPRHLAELAHLPPHLLMMQPRKSGDTETIDYVYGDPNVCHCIFAGNADDFSRFQQLAFQKRLADQYLAAAEMDDAAYGWRLWGPWMYGPELTVDAHSLDHSHDHDHDHH